MMITVTSEAIAGSFVRAHLSRFRGSLNPGVPEGRIPGLRSIEAMIRGIFSGVAVVVE